MAMIKWTLSVGAVLIPFYEVVVRILPYALVDTPNTRDAKDVLALIIAIGIGLMAIYEGAIKKFDNKWLLILIGYLFISLNMGFKMPFQINDITYSTVWAWKPIVKALCYLLMLVAVSSIDFRRSEIEHLLKIIAWCGFLMAVYVILQETGIDQWYKVRTDQPTTAVTNAALVGTLGQPTIVAPFISFIIPICLYLKRKFFVVVMVSAVLLINSLMATGAMLASIAIYVTIGHPRALMVMAICAVLSVPVIWNKIVSNDSGRIVQWQLIYEDIKEGPIDMEDNQEYGITGVGLGGFSLFYHTKNKSGFYQAHNEYLQIFWELGIVGLGLFIMANFYALSKAIKEAWSSRSRALTAVISGYLCICLCCIGTFLWQLGPYQWYSALLFGLLSNKSIQWEA